MQFVGIPYALLFGRISEPDGAAPRRLPRVRRLQPRGAPLGGRRRRPPPAGRRGRAPPRAVRGHGHGRRRGDARPAAARAGERSSTDGPRRRIEARPQVATGSRRHRLTLRFHGRRVRILVYASGPEHGIFAVHLDGKPHAGEGRGRRRSTATRDRPLRGRPSRSRRARPATTVARGAPRARRAAHGCGDRRLRGVAAEASEQPAPDPRPAVLLQVVGAAFALGFGKAVFGTRRRGDDHEADDPPRARRLRRDRHLGVLPRLRDRVLVPRVAGRRRAGRLPGALPLLYARMSPAR